MGSSRSAGGDLGERLIRIRRSTYHERQKPVQYPVPVMSPARGRLPMDFAPGAINPLAAGRRLHDVPNRLATPLPRLLPCGAPFACHRCCACP